MADPADVRRRYVGVSPTARSAAGALPRGLPQLLLELLSLDRYVPRNSGEFAVITFSPETEEILRAKAAQTGRTPDEILREVLSRTGAVAEFRCAPAGEFDQRRIDRRHGGHRRSQRGATRCRPEIHRRNLGLPR
jgi:hypothetical protein